MLRLVHAGVRLHTCEPYARAMHVILHDIKLGLPCNIGKPWALLLRPVVLWVRRDVWLCIGCEISPYLQIGKGKVYRSSCPCACPTGTKNPDANGQRMCWWWCNFCDVVCANTVSERPQHLLSRIETGYLVCHFVCHDFIITELLAFVVDFCVRLEFVDN